MGCEYMRRTGWLIVPLCIVLLTACLVILYPTESYAWSCMNSLNPKDQYKQNDAVFSGTATEITSQDTDNIVAKNKVTFQVHDDWKNNGLIGNSVTVVYSAGSEFVLNKDYLVYAYMTTEDNYLYSYVEGELATDMMCGGTKELILAGDDLMYIGSKNRMWDRIAGGLIGGGLTLLVLLAFRYIRRRELR